LALGSLKGIEKPIGRRSYARSSGTGVLCRQARLAKIHSSYHGTRKWKLSMGNWSHTTVASCLGILKCIEP